jgi:ketosteroid isomerase-like protein
MTTEEEKVLEANKNFYTALQDLSIEEMDAVWLQEDWVRCLHPGWNLLEGWEAVRESWQHIFENTHFMRIAVALQSLHVDNSTAWVCCTEKISSASEGRFDSAYVQATNIFECRQGNWYVVHHHSSPLPMPWPDEGAAEVVQ